MKSFIVSEILRGDLLGGLSVASKEETRLVGIVADLDDEVREKLSAEQYSLVKKFTEALENLTIEEVDRHYLEGFKCGLKIAVECFNG